VNNPAEFTSREYAQGAMGYINGPQIARKDIIRKGPHRYQLMVTWEHGRSECVPEWMIHWFFDRGSV